MRHWFHEHSVKPLDARAHSGRCNDHARRPVPADHCLRSRLAQPGLGLPFFFVKYGGSVLWGTMVFFLVAMAAPARSPSSIALISATVAVGVELFRLVHTPSL